LYFRVPAFKFLKKRGDFGAGPMPVAYHRQQKMVHKRFSFLRHPGISPINRETGAEMVLVESGQYEDRFRNGSFFPTC
jgi:hypothetical protein